MRVKKFEAKTMKDALRMVKNELGPDAVILAARDNRKAFGLAGEGSVEVTAAVSESTLHKKKFVESRMREGDRARFQQSTARSQKRVIEQMTEERIRRFDEENEPRRPITRTSYIDIQDEELPQSRASNSRQAPRQQMQEAGGGTAPQPNAEQARTRIRNAVREAWRAGITTAEEPKSQVRGHGSRVTGAERVPHATAVVPASAKAEASEFEIINLKQEINRLQEMVKGFAASAAQPMPQTFVGAHPGAEHGIHYDLSFMFQKLMEAGISVENAVDILSSAQKDLDAQQIKKRPLVDAYVGRWFLNHIQTSAQPFAGRIHCFVGPSGSGKTSALVKMASQLVVNEKKRVAILTTDAVKVGAADQLKIYSQILNIPFAIIRNQREWAWVLSQLNNVDHVLVDYPGLQLGNMEDIGFLKSILPPEEAAANFHLVLSATAKDGDALELARRYQVTKYNDLVFTNLDQSVQHGLIYNVHKKTGKPLHSFGTGTRLPEDFELATKERVLDLIFRLTRIRK